MMKMNNVSVSGRKRREEKVMTEAATMGRSVTALPTQEASHHSGAPEVLLVQLKHRTSVWSPDWKFVLSPQCGGCDTR